jgi:hypothetical protein
LFSWVPKEKPLAPVFTMSPTVVSEGFFRSSYAHSTVHVDMCPMEMKTLVPFTT